MMSQTITLVFDATSGENTALRDEMQQQLCDFFAQREETQAICNEETPPAFISVESRFGPGAPGSTITYH
jgi:hypothetical protein